MFDWFWEWSVMRTLQSWVDTTRSIDPIWLLICGMLIVFAVIRAMSAPPAMRDQSTMGAHYLGKITPKSLKRMLRTPKPRRHIPTRAEKIEDLKLARMRRRDRARRDKGE